MKEIPIIFSTPMIRAIFEGRKMQTRRVIKPQPTNRPRWNCIGFLGWDDGHGYEIKCPYGPVGTTLWVRETTFLYGRWAKNGLAKSGKQKWKFIWDKSKPVLYMDCPPDDIKRLKTDVGYFKRPSIHMPHEACRLRLEITDIKPERLQDISEEDAMAEGITSYWAEPHRDDAPFIGAAKELGADLCFTRRKAFQQLWDSINAKRGHGWDKNDWVWAILFEMKG